MKFIKPKELLALIGSFWTRIFTSAPLLRTIFGGALAIHRQTEIVLDILTGGISNKEVFPGKIQAWAKFTFSSYSQTKVEYGDAYTYGSSLFYDTVATNAVSYDISPNIVSIPFLYDRIAKPTLVLTEGVDYVIRKSKIVFKQPLSATESVTMYGKNVIRDTGFIDTRLGYALDVQLSDRVYRSVPFEVIWRLYSYGPNYQDLIRLLGGAAGTPVAKQDQTVEAIFHYGANTHLITNIEAYIIPTNKVPNVKVGATIKAGTPISTAVQVIHDKGVYILSSDIPDLYKEPKFLKYGGMKGQASSLIIIKADLAGPASAALKVIRDVTPPEVKILIFANIDLAPANLINSNFGVQCVAAQSKIMTDIPLTTHLSTAATALLKY